MGASCSSAVSGAARRGLAHHQLRGKATCRIVPSVDSSRSAAAAPISRMGWRTLVSGVMSSEATEISS